MAVEFRDDGPCFYEQLKVKCNVFLPRLALLSAVLVIVIPSVRQSVTRVHCDQTKERTANILTPHDTNAGWWAMSTPT